MSDDEHSSEIDSDKDPPAQADPTVDVTPPLGTRVTDMLLEPVATFRQHHAGWGWAAPLVLVALLGVLSGTLTLILGNPIAQLEAQMDEQLAKARDDAVKKGADPEKLEEGLEFGRKIGMFFARVGLVAGPPLGALISLVVMGAILFGIQAMFSPGRQGDLMLSLSVAAWCMLADGVSYALRGVAVLLGSPMPMTSPIYVVDQTQAPVAAALLSRLDPCYLLYYVLLWGGLTGSLKVSRRTAWVVCLALYGTFTVLALGSGFAAKFKA